MVESPIFTNSYMSLPELGEFFDIVSPSDCPSSNCPLDPLPDFITSEMIQMIISDFTLNTAGWAFYKIGTFTATVTDSDIPSWSPVRLNTESFKILIPELYETYGSAEMELSLESTQPPFGVFSNTFGASISAVGDLNAIVLTSPSPSTAFTLSGVISLAGTAQLSGLFVIGNLTYLHGNFSLESSSIGKFDVNVLNDLLNLLFSSGVIPKINKQLQSGFPLPTVEGLTFNSPSIGWGDHYFYVSTDVTYTPPMNSHPMKIV